jgi:hypothetical protein
MSLKGYCLQHIVGGFKTLMLVTLNGEVHFKECGLLVNKDIDDLTIAGEYMHNRGEGFGFWSAIE